MRTVCALLIDLQGDFTELADGALKVPGTGKEYVDAVFQAVRVLKEKGIPVIATKDWHPPNHISFFTNHPGKKPFEEIEIEGRKQILWPPHCVQGSPGARLLIPEDSFLRIVEKGTDPKYDSYSGFEDEGGNKTNLDQALKEIGAQRLIIFGLATDYCVLATIRDARKRNYEVIFVEDLSRGVQKETVDRALAEMRALGVRIVKSLSEALK